MKRVFAILLVAMALAAPCSAKDAPRASYTELFDAVWQTIDENFYDPSFGGVDWKAVREKYRPDVTRIESDSAFLAIGYRMMRELRVSHLELVPPRLPQVSIGVRTTPVEGRMVVTTIAIASDAQEEGMEVGDVLLDPPGDLYGQIGTSATVHVQGCDGSPRTLQVRRENPWWPPQHPSLRWNTIDQGNGRRLGYIRAVRFDDDAAPLIDSAMEAMKGTYGLIVDLRDNSGGNVSSLRLASYLIPRPEAAVTLLSRPYLERLGSAPERLDLSEVPHVSGVYTTAGILDAMKKHAGGVAFDTEDMGDRAYPGMVAILINRGTGSASEGFAALMKGRKSITLVGSATAGALFGSERFAMPGGWELTVPTHASWGPDGRRYVDQVVTPDLAVTWTRRQLCEGRDSDIAAALELLRSAK
jgi:carboxyl-terminal processing protease